MLSGSLQHGGEKNSAAAHSQRSASAPGSDPTVEQRYRVADGSSWQLPSLGTHLAAQRIAA